ncbi:hypothetical protein BY458DRAFT_545515 [Sporodiniella umbellata]|nr:hypothetical protein BY458DRAFT_545515 [Sporodiniella umbellata]
MEKVVIELSSFEVLSRFDLRNNAWSVLSFCEYRTLLKLRLSISGHVIVIGYEENLESKHDTLYDCHFDYPKELPQNKNRCFKHNTSSNKKYQTFFILFFFKSKQKPTLSQLCQSAVYLENRCVVSCVLVRLPGYMYSIADCPFLTQENLMSVSSIVASQECSSLPSTRPHHVARSPSPISSSSSSASFRNCCKMTEENELPLTIEERRSRNKAASAKYRQKKNQQQVEMRYTISKLSKQNAVLEQQLHELRLENEKLKTTSDKLRGKMEARKMLKKWIATHSFYSGDFTSE